MVTSISQLMCFFPVSITRNNQERVVKCVLKCSCVKNHPEKLLYQQKKQDADTSSERLRFRFESPATLSHHLSSPLSVEHMALRVVHVTVCCSRPGATGSVWSDHSLLGENVFGFLVFFFGVFFLHFIFFDKAYIFSLKIWLRAI